MYESYNGIFQSIEFVCPIVTWYRVVCSDDVGRHCLRLHNRGTALTRYKLNSRQFTKGTSVLLFK